MANYTQKLCRCNVNGTVCSYKHYQECKTSLWGPELPCKLLESKRKRRDVEMLQDIYSLYQKQNQSKVNYKTNEHSHSCKLFIFIDEYIPVSLFSGKIDFILFQRYRRQATKSQVEAGSVCKKAFENAKHYEICLNYIPNFSNETLENCIQDLMVGENTYTYFSFDIFSMLNNSINY